MSAADLEEKQHRSADGLSPGAEVLVWCRFDKRWVGGFRIDSRTGTAYRLLRDSDGAVLPADFDAIDLTAAHRADR